MPTLGGARLAWRTVATPCSCLHVRALAHAIRRGRVALLLLRLALAALALGPILSYLLPYTSRASNDEAAPGKPTSARAAARHQLERENQLSQILVVDTGGQEHAFELLLRHLRQTPELAALPVIRVPAVNATRLDLHALVHSGKLSRDGYGSVIQTMPARDHRLTVGAVGSYMAHANAWSMVAASGRTTLVLEDNVRLLASAGTSHFFSKVVQRVLPEADLVYLGNVTGEEIAENLHEYDEYFSHMVGGHHGTCAYILHPRAARVLVRQAYPIRSGVDLSIVRAAIANGLRVLNSRTTLVSVDEPPLRRSRFHPEDTRPELLIPRLVHFIWFGGAPPARVTEAMSQWRAINPGWDVRLWTDGDMPSTFSRMYPTETFDDLREKSDLARYQLIEQYGGVYFDVDFLPLRPIDEILGGVSAFVAYENDVNLANSPIGAVPGHPFLRRVNAEVSARRREAHNISVNVRTGPHFLRDVVALYRLYQSDLTVFSNQVFFPFYFDEPDPGPPYGRLHYAVHKWHAAP